MTYRFNILRERIADEILRLIRKIPECRICGRPGILQNPQWNPARRDISPILANIYLDKV